MKFILPSITLTELAMVLAVAVLEYLSGYHAGIMHHLYYKKRIYLSTALSDQVLLHLLPVGASLTAMAWTCHRRRPAPATIVPIRYATVLLALLLTATLPGFRHLNTSVHLLVVLEFCLVLESVRMVVLTRTRVQ